MKNLKILILILFASLSVQQALYAQQTYAPLKGRLTQYMLHQPFFNPGAMGSYESFTAAAFYRNQWVGVEGSPNVQGLDVTMPLGEKNFIGFNLIRDDIANGYENRYDFNLSYAFKMQLTDEDYLSLGLSASGNYIKNDLSGSVAINPNDPLLNRGVETYFAPNMKIGAYYFREGVYGGVAISNIFSTKAHKTDESGYKTEYLNWNEIDYLLHGGTKLVIGEYWDLDLSTLLRYNVSSNFQADFNALFMYNDIFGIGATYRTNNEFAVLTNFRFLDNFRVGYSYGTFFSELGGQSSGTHEIMLIFELGDPQGTSIIVPRF